MCGIAGYANLQKPASAEVVSAMCARIRHRGPDDEGVYTGGPCGIGMRRLSIIDLATGHQPISNESGDIWVVFNGEIYNFAELRARLESRGHVFRTRTDTEVLVHLYEEEGTAGIERLAGMFAFAIWDSRKRRLLLARDRFGKKPLYYAQTSEGFYFASEIKCLHAAGVDRGGIDEDALKLYFQFSYVPDPYTPFRNIRKLPAGCWLSFDASGHAAIGRYWRLPPPNAECGDVSEGEYEARIRDRFDAAVRKRMIADVPLGAFLSGGLDSSSVVASMARQSGAPVKTFSIGFEEAKYNELGAARLTAEKYGTEHHEILVRPDAISLVEKLAHHFDEPFGDSSAIPAYAVSEFAARHVKVALSGDGGDELFGGYTSVLGVRRLKRLDRVPVPVRAAIGALAEALPYSAYGKNYLRMISRATALERYLEFNSAPWFLRRRLLRPEYAGDAAFVIGALADSFLPNGAEAVAQAMYFDATANLTGDMLVKVDRMSMAHSLEVRCPLLDHDLAELAMSIPHCMKLRGGRGKYILARALGDRLPAQLLTLPKKGFSVPLPQWLRGPLRGFVADHILGTRFLSRGIVSPPFVRSLADEHQSGRRDNSRWLWSLLMLEVWFRQTETLEPVR